MTAVDQRIISRDSKIKLPLVVKQQNKTMQRGNGPYADFKAGYTPLVFGEDKIKKQKTVIEREVLEDIIGQKGNVYHIAEYRSRDAHRKVIGKIRQHCQKRKNKKGRKKMALVGIGVVLSRIVNKDKNDKHRRTEDNI
jgi:hypothetical protein